MELRSLDSLGQHPRSSHVFGPGGLGGEELWDAAYPFHEGNFHRKLYAKISGGCKIKCSGIRKCQSDVSCAVFPLCPLSV